MTRKTALLILAIVVVVIFLPAAAVSLGGCPNFSWQADLADPKEEEGKKGVGEITLYHAEQKKVTEMDLEEYLVGVLIAEMPSTFEMEALKAQAVIARTYALHQHRSLGGYGCDRAPGKADICSDSTHCQAWLDPEETAAGWGSEGESALRRIREAVSKTAGEVVVYRGKLIEAVYHSTCGGKTETSGAIWSGGVLPYLQSVNCPYCKHSPYYREELTITFAQLAAALPPGFALPVISGETLQLEPVTETLGGRVEMLKIEGALIEGKELRRLLGLPSTAFTWETKGKELLFHIRGRGHGVGLCQYGADGAARKGKNYLQIIKLYYPGCSIISLRS